MKKTITLIKGMLIPIFVLISLFVEAQVPAAQVKICNDTLLNSKNYQFDVYIRAKQANGLDTFNLEGFQGSFQDSLKNIKGTGLVSASVVPGSSQLGTNPPQQPTVVLVKPLPANPLYLQLNPTSLTTNGMRIYDSLTDPLNNGGWLRACTIRVTDTVDFLQGKMNLFFSTIVTYPTVVYANYLNPSAISGTIPIDTLNLTYNPILNKPVTKFNVTNNGNVINLSGSELRCAYRLVLNGVPQLSTEVIGTGNPITWTNNANGSYYVIGRRIATYIADSMTGGITVSVGGVPAAGPITGPTTVCQGQTGVTYYTLKIANADTMLWNYTGTGVTITFVNDTIITFTFSSNATSGNLYVYGKSFTLGTGLPTILAITVNSAPANAGAITGPTIACYGQSAVTYTVPPITNATSYNWTLPVGVTGSGFGNSIVVNYSSSSNSGLITVHGINFCGNGGSSSLGISVYVLPPAPAVDSVPPIAYGASNVTVIAHANGNPIQWFHTPYGGTSFCNDSIYHTGTMNTNDTLYVQDNSGVNSLVTLGTGTLVNGTSTYPTPYGQFYNGSREQYFILASELNALGVQAGPIQSIAFNLASAYPGNAMINFTIKIAPTNLSAITSTFIDTNLTQVYLNPSLTPTVGWNTYNFNAPYYWDGTSNLILQTCFENYPTGYSNNGIVYSTQTSYNSSLSWHADVGSTCIYTTGIFSMQRPNIKFSSTITACASNRTTKILKVLPPAPTTYNMGGTVFTGVVPVDHALAYLFDSTLSVVDSCNVDSLGFYNFYQKPAGNYKVQSVLKPNSSFLGQYTPTYYPNKSFWNTADTIKLFSNQWAKDIHMHQVGTIPQGAGSIGGTVTTGQKTMLAAFEVLLLDTAFNTLTCKYTDQNGYFSFDNLAFGKYVVYPEVPGKVTTPLSVTLSSTHPNNKDINYIVSATTVMLSIKDIQNNTAKLCKVYPNPVNNQLTIEINSNTKENYVIEDLLGRVVYSSYVYRKTTLDVSALPKGIYLFKLTTDKGNVIKKFIKE